MELCSSPRRTIPGANAVYEFAPGATTGADAKAIASGLITQGASPGLAVKGDGTMLLSTVILAGEPMCATVYEFASGIPNPT